MNKVINMSEFPPLVWDSIYDKWKLALRTGWQYDIWNRCAMCEWLDITGHACLSCPLNPEWCRAVPSVSPLHIRYHDDNEVRWVATVEAFLKFLKPHCTYETNEHKDNSY